MASRKPSRPSSFRARVIAAVRRIPPGRVATYGDIAAVAGFPRAFRAVGTVMRESHDPSLPCHRVIAAGGLLGGYGGNLQLKRELLRAEGHEVSAVRVRGFDAVRWPGAMQRRATPGREAARSRR
jgi:methylated-DNA-[protein]-cysteine S-methyltransferase